MVDLSTLVHAALVPLARGNNHDGVEDRGGSPRRRLKSSHGKLSFYFPIFLLVLLTRFKICKLSHEISHANQTQGSKDKESLYSSWTIVPPALLPYKWAHFLHTAMGNTAPSNVVHFTNKINQSFPFGLIAPRVTRQRQTKP